MAPTRYLYVKQCPGTDAEPGLADGAEVFASPVAGTDAPRTLDVDISGKDEIVLSIEFGDDFLDLSDHLNWCDARFVKTTD